MNRLHLVATLVATRLKAVVIVSFIALFVFVLSNPIYALNTTTSTISGFSDTSAYGDSVTFMATVSDFASGGITPSGTVTFKDGSADLGSATLQSNTPSVGIALASEHPPMPGDMKVSCHSGPGSEGSTTCPVLQWGDYTYWAHSYNDNGDAMGIVAYDSSGNIVKQWKKTGARYLWQISVDTSAKTITFWGQGSSFIVVPWADFENATASASVTTSALAPGAHSITVEYAGDDDHMGSTSAAYTHMVNPIMSLVSVASSNSTVVYGETVTLTATVTVPGEVPPIGASGPPNGDPPIGIDVIPIIGPPIGTITFKEDGNVLGITNVSLGQATYSTSMLPAGVHTITAEYSGDAIFSSSTSSAISIQVDLRSNAVLSGLELQGMALNQPYQASTLSYTATVSNLVNAVTVLTSLEDATASVQVNGNVGTLLANGQISTPINLAVGTNTLQIIVTAQNGTTQTAYTIVVTRAGLDNTDLSGLVLSGSGGGLSPAFSSGTLLYASTVSNSVYQVTVTPTATGNGSTVKVNGISVISGQASIPVNLNVGSNLITVEVTAQDGVNKKTYSILVTRSSAEKLGAAQALLKISSMYDSNHDGKFDAEDVREILLQIEPVFVTS
ncbi:Ig-like domain repeat protein [Paenibacillus agricola]|uniref:Cadherin-like beta sandwich domain-containing protein n=1 Tax=Paenibacillus agricola TaxID=2716264 RepID=A0ABX0J6S9_9BACL|nr:cadherin-like beta sandwich domain-containing protein [Paenibacillus agricola]NHN31847.1 hypothetical protein [Paenibacillus agricola]